MCCLRAKTDFLGPCVGLWGGGVQTSPLVRPFYWSFKEDVS